MVDVVVFESDCVEFAGQEDAPVVVGVAAGGPRGSAVYKVIRNGDTGVLGVASYQVLAADEGGGYVTDPDVGASVEGDG